MPLVNTILSSSLGLLVGLLPGHSVVIGISTDDVTVSMKYSSHFNFSNLPRMIAFELNEEIVVISSMITRHILKYFPILE